jgi:hypothetical protein
MRQGEPRKRDYMRKVIRTLMISAMVGGMGVMPVATGTAFANNNKPPQTIVRPGDGGQAPPQMIRPADGPSNSHQPPQ